jgi:CheY-like chemotaxis protein
MGSRETTPRDEPSVPAQPAGTRVRVLLVTAGDAGARVAAVVDEVDDPAGIEIVRCADLAAGIAHLGAAGTDVVLLGLPLPPHQGLRPLVEIRAAAPAVPVVVLCEAVDEPLALRAVQLGARDYLLAERLYGTLVVRSLLHAVEAERVRALLAHRHREWPPFFGGGEAGQRPASLHVALPDRFATLVAVYGDLLDHAVERVVSGATEPAEQPIQGLARQAAELRASPRDIIEIHATAMKEREAREGSQRLKLYVAEGRIRLLELMGHLAGAYRDLWLSAGRDS